MVRLFFFLGGGAMYHVAEARKKEVKMAITRWVGEVSNSAGEKKCTMKMGAFNR